MLGMCRTDLVAWEAEADLSGGVCARDAAGFSMLRGGGGEEAMVEANFAKFLGRFWSSTRT